jgi:ribose transport system permease protein
MARNQWSWAASGSGVLWIIACVLSHRVSVQLLLVNCTLASFLVLVALGQMVVITSGDGSFDLSLPYTLMLSAFVSGIVMSGSGRGLVPGIAAGLAASCVVGIVNAMLIVLLRVPPVIATLATGYITYSVILQMSGATQAAPSPGLKRFALSQLHGASPVAGVVIILCVLLLAVLVKTRFGFYLEAMGQGRRAAQLAGVPITRMVVVNFVVSALMGGLAGLLLVGFDGGAFLTMGNPYLLGPIGAVVIGGTLIGGGRWSVAGTMAAGLFLTLLVTVMELSKLPIGYEDVLEGLVVIGFIVVASVVRRRGFPY